MKITYTTPPDAVVESWHTDRVLPFDVGSYKRDLGRFDIFKEVNEYWLIIPKDKQIELFELYEKAFEVFRNFFTLEELTVTLRGICSAIVDIHDFEHMELWVTNKSELRIPKNIKSEFSYSIDKADTRERTYIRSDYVSHLVYCMICRMMLPIWGRYMDTHKSQQGNYKEMNALSLLEDSKLSMYKGQIKLAEYLAGIAGENRGDATLVVHSGINSNNYDRWLLSIASVKRGAVVDIRGLEEHPVIITSIHSFTKHRAEGKDVPHADRMKAKEVGSDSKQDETKASAIEITKVQQSLPIGIEEEMRYAVRDPYEYGPRICSTMKTSDLKRVLREVEMLKTVIIEKQQKLLASWILADVVSPKSINTRPKSYTLEALAVTHCVLWELGHKELAILVTAIPNRDDDVLTVRNETKNVIPKELQTQLDAVFPYMKITGGKKTGQKPVSMVKESIENMVAGFTKYRWTATCDFERIKEVYGNDANRRMNAPDNIRSLIASLVIELGKKPN